MIECAKKGIIRNWCVNEIDQEGVRGRTLCLLEDLVNRLQKDNIQKCDSSWRVSNSTCECIKANLQLQEGQMRAKQKLLTCPSAWPLCLRCSRLCCRTPIRPLMEHNGPREHLTTGGQTHFSNRRRAHNESQFKSQERKFKYYGSHPNTGTQWQQSHRIIRSFCSNGGKHGHCQGILSQMVILWTCASLQ